MQGSYGQFMVEYNFIGNIWHIIKGYPLSKINKKRKKDQSTLAQYWILYHIHSVNSGM